MKYNIGDTVKLNKNISNDSLWGVFAVIIEVLVDSTYQYKIRYRNLCENSLEHFQGDVKETWIDRI